MWVYKNGKCVLTLDTIVTGTVETKLAHKNLETPTGVWYIHYKESPSVLKGTNDDGSKYSVDVKYWMPFVGNVGFHSASWRNSFGGSIYINNGSHGCVNLSEASAKQLYSLVEKGGPVVTYY